ncbi:TetR/AcrR family transcriptional regulator [Kitasatospora sp. NPDC056327]|uniref:TetR/AcrR family transcriptional regulator n=1 Tax=Kitasatospora sp. NPDC056327 TaxID=3345785 RepID=UPI0035E259C6
MRTHLSPDGTTAPTASAAPPAPSPAPGDGAEPARRTQAERRARAERALLAAAARLVAEHGSAGVTLARVGEEAGFSRGLASHYFGSRGALLARLQEEALTEAMAAAAPERSGRGAVEELCAFARACLDGVRQPTDLGRAFVVLGAEALAGASELTGAVALLDARMRDRVAEVVRQGAAEGQVRPEVDPDAAAAALVGLLKGLIVQAATAPGALALDRATSEAERWIRLALTTA